MLFKIHAQISLSERNFEQNDRVNQLGEVDDWLKNGAISKTGKLNPFKTDLKCA